MENTNTSNVILVCIIGAREYYQLPPQRGDERAGQEAGGVPAQPAGQRRQRRGGVRDLLLGGHVQNTGSRSIRK